MRSLPFLLIGFSLALLTACHHNGNSDDDGGGPPDAAIPDAMPACNAFEQTGCAGGEKCTWVNIDSANDLGTIACVPDGTVADGGACQYGADGETTGFDNCVAGEICISGGCEPICTISPDSCDANHSCQRYAGLFTGATPELGACDPLCDPVTQELLGTPPVAACGGTGTGINATRGCYGVFDGNFSCAGVPGTVASNPGMYAGESDTAYGPATGGAYLNGCAPGYAPLLRNANDAAAPVVCMAYCRPAPTDNGANAANQGGQLASGFTCGDRNELTQSCEYFWVFETFDAATPPAHPDQIGYCWTPENYVGEWNGTGTGAIPWPRCNTVADSDVDMTGNNAGTRDTLYWGCVPYATAATGAPPHHATSPFHLATPSEMEKHGFH
jgi:hypothetical protein